jgi:hypothetical protein
VSRCNFERTLIIPSATASSGVSERSESAG